jgi:hypothetical protein
MRRRFRAVDRVFFPYFTSFSADKHWNVSAWLDGSPIWERDAYTRDEFPFLYLRRDHPQRDELMRLEPFTRLEVTGVVRDVYRARPWIEITAFRATPATLGRRVVEWVKTGDGYAARGDATRADAYYALALAQVSLEETYAMRIRKRRGDVLRAAGRDADAAAVEGGKTLGGTPIPPPEAAAPPVVAPDAAPAARGGDTFPEGESPSTRVGVPAEPPASTGARPSAITEDLPGVPYGTPAPRRDPPAPGPAPAPKPAPEPPPTPGPRAGPVETAPPPAEGSASAWGPEFEGMGELLVVPRREGPRPPPPPRTPRLSGVR